MFRDVFLQEAIPRDISTFNSTFIEGWQMFRYFGYFFLVGAIVLFLLAAFKFKMVLPSIILLLVAVGGYMMVKKANDRAAERKEIFLKGEIVKAKVIQHGRKFNFLKSSKDYTITVEPRNKGSEGNLTIVNKREALWKEAPIGTEILGITHQGKYFFGEEMGCQFKLFEK